MIDPTEKYGPPPMRSENPEGWREWRNAIWSETFEITAQMLTGLAEQLRDGLPFEGDLSIACALDTVMNAIVNAKQFYLNEVWLTGQERARDLLAGVQAAAEAPDFDEILQRFLQGDDSGG